MFHPARLALIHGDSSPRSLSVASPLALGEPSSHLEGTRLIAFLIDVAGQDEAILHSPVEHAALQNPARDSTSLSIVEIDLSTLRTLHSPTYRVVQRFAWLGQNHVSVLGTLMALAEHWNPQHLVVDATGVGEGLWVMLDKEFPTRVHPVKFSQQQKSEIGWRFLAIIETGRFRDGSAPSALHPASSHVMASTAMNLVHPDAARLQYANCQSEILPGPAKILRWGVPEGTRGPDGELVHDDFVIADSLVAVLDRLDWRIPVVAAISHAPDPLASMSQPAAPRASQAALESPPRLPAHSPVTYDPLDEMSRIH
jgi:hypothetical protein